MGNVALVELLTETEPKVTPLASEVIVAPPKKSVPLRVTVFLVTPCPRELGETVETVGPE